MQQVSQVRCRTVSCRDGQEHSQISLRDTPDERLPVDALTQVVEARKRNPNRKVHPLQGVPGVWPSGGLLATGKVTDEKPTFG